MTAKRDVRRGSAEQRILFSRLIDAIKGDRDRLIAQILHETGCTVKELVELRVSKVRRGYITFDGSTTKSGRTRKVKISSDLQRKVKRSASGSKAGDFLFQTRQSNKLTTRRVEQIFKEASASIGKKLTPRDMRAWKIEELRRKGTSVQDQRDEVGIYSLRERPAASRKSIKKATQEIDSLRDELIFSIISETACTVSELVNIRKKDVGSRHIMLTRRGRRRAVQVPASLVRKLKLFSKGHKEGEHLFATRQSETITPRRIQQIFRSISEDAGLQESITPNRLRNRIVSEMTKPEIREKLQIRHVKIYTHSYRI